MRLSTYMRQERAILHAEGEGIIYRWKFGRRLVLDDTATLPDGRLRKGTAQKLVIKAQSEGIKLSEREVRYRVQAAKTYPTEAEIRQVLAEFETWWALISAGFPAVEVPDPGDPYDPRWASEKERDSNRKWKRAVDAILKRAQGVMFSLDEFTSLGEYEKALAERTELDARRLQEDAAAAIELEQLLAAVGGDRSATIGDALGVLESEFDDEDDTDTEQ